MPLRVHRWNPPRRSRHRITDMPRRSRVHNLAEALTISKERTHSSEAERWPAMKADENWSLEATPALLMGGRAPPSPPRCQVWAEVPIQDGKPLDHPLSLLWFLVYPPHLLITTQLPLKFVLLQGGNLLVKECQWPCLQFSQEIIYLAPCSPIPRNLLIAPAPGRYRCSLGGWQSVCWAYFHLKPPAEGCWDRLWVFSWPCAWASTPLYPQFFSKYQGPSSDNSISI